MRLRRRQTVDSRASGRDLYKLNQVAARPARSPSKRDRQLAFRQVNAAGRLVDGTVKRCVEHPIEWVQSIYGDPSGRRGHQNRE
jgi:hypothetical protein